MANAPYASDVEAAEDFVVKYNALSTEISKKIIGQHEVVKQVLIAIFSGGHVLLVGVPGLAKTLLVNTISEALGLDFSRIQFTPDLMPSDIVGAEILNNQKQFEFIKGPIFANVILADEINRTPPKTQSALLEAMQEKKVTVAGKSMPLNPPFFVLATQNPIEQEGTYPLPEAQLDRFMFNIWVDYPSLEEELAIVKATTSENNEKVNAVLSGEQISFFQQLMKRIPVPDGVYQYAVELVNKTRPQGTVAPDLVKQYVAWGAGPRASQYLIQGAKTHALLNGKLSPDREDVVAVALPILRHRVVPNYKAEAEGYTVEKIIEALL